MPCLGRPCSEAAIRGKKLAKHSHKVPKDFNISESQVVSVTHDEAANMACAAAKPSEDHKWASQVCMAHRLQTVIRHAIEDSRPVEKLLTTSSRLVRHFRHSSLSTEVLFKKQIELDKTKQAKKVFAQCTHVATT